jgi:hypothetical protein
MPARVNKIRHDENTREKIKAAHIINRLQAFFFGTNDPVTKQLVKLDMAQVNVGLALLKKSLPDLTSVEISGEISTSKVIRAPAVSATVSDWASTHIPDHLKPTEH